MFLVKLKASKMNASTFKVMSNPSNAVPVLANNQRVFPMGYIIAVLFIVLLKLSTLSSQRLKKGSSLLCFHFNA